MPSMNLGRRPTRTIPPSHEAPAAPENRRRELVMHLASVMSYPRDQELRYLTGLLRAPNGEEVVRRELLLLKEAQKMGVLGEKVAARAAMIAEAKRCVDAGEVDDPPPHRVTRDGDLEWTSGTTTRTLYRDGCEDYRQDGTLHRRGGPAETAPGLRSAWYERGRRVDPSGASYAWAA